MSEPKTAKADILEATRGMPHNQSYVAPTKPWGGLEPKMAVRREHLEFLAHLGKEGVLLGADPSGLRRTKLEARR